MVEKNGIRSIERITGHHRDTIGQLLEDLALHAEMVNSIIPDYYAETCVDYGQLLKIKEGGKIVDKIKIIVYGNPCYSEIETTDIENMNSIFRERLGRLVRKTKCYSKKKPRLVDAVELYQLWSWEEFFNCKLSILN